MHRHTVSALALGLLICAAGGSRQAGDSGDSSPLLDTEDTAALLGAGVLVYHGHGGASAAGIDGHLGQGGLELLDELDVEHRDDWPEDFSPYRLVILPAPGAHDSSATFSAVQRGDLLSVTHVGGLVVVLSAPGTLVNDDVLNDLVWDLGASMYTTGEALEQGEATRYPYQDHPLTEGVERVGLDIASAVGGEESCLLVVDDDRCVAAAATAGAGWIVLLGAGDLLDDPQGWAESGMDNELFIHNLAQLP